MVSNANNGTWVKMDRRKHLGSTPASTFYKTGGARQPGVVQSSGPDKPMTTHALYQTGKCIPDGN